MATYSDVNITNLNVIKFVIITKYILFTIRDLSSIDLCKMRHAEWKWRWILKKELDAEVARRGRKWNVYCLVYYLKKLRVISNKNVILQVALGDSWPSFHIWLQLVAGLKVKGNFWCTDFTYF